MESFNDLFYTNDVSAATRSLCANLLLQCKPNWFVTVAPISSHFHACPGLLLQRRGTVTAHHTRVRGSLNRLGGAAPSYTRHLSSRPAPRAAKPRHDKRQLYRPRRAPFSYVCVLRYRPLLGIVVSRAASRGVRACSPVVRPARPTREPITRK